MTAEMEPTDPGYLAQGVRPPPRGEDLPYDDGEPMETARHYQQMSLLIETLDDHWRDRDDVFVGGNMFVYFSEIQARKRDFRGPDFFVVMDTTRRERKSWVVWEEDGRTPDLVIELTSPSTEHVDRGDKMRIYAHLRVAEYVLFDPWTAKLEAYELDGATRTYHLRAPGENGRYASRVTGLALGVVEGTYRNVETKWLRWLTPEGAVLPSSRDLADAVRARASAETARADAETARADAETSRADAETARADAETARADAATMRIAELEAALARR